MSQSLHQQAQFLRLSEDSQGAYIFTSKWIKKQPVNPLAWVEHAAALNLKYEFTRANRAMEKALRFSKKNIEIYLIAAEAMVTSYCSNDSIEILKKALVLDPERSTVKIKLAKELERQHHTDEAQDLLSELPSLPIRHPDSLEASFVNATLLKREGNVAEALDLLSKIIRETEITEQSKEALWQAHNLRVQCLDSLKAYPEAIQAFQETSQYTLNNCQERIVEMRKAWDSTQISIRTMCQSTSKEQLIRWQKRTTNDEQDLIFLSGHPRSGTTLTGTILSSHPDTELIDERNIFFSEAFIPLTKHFKRGTPDIERLEMASENLTQKYAQIYFQKAEKCVRASLDNKTLVDKHPLHVFSLASTLKILPHSKHLVMLRDPRAIALSCMFTTMSITPFSVNWLDPLSTAKAFDTIMETWIKIQDWQLPNIHQLRYEDLIADQERETRRIVSELNLTWDDRLINYQEQARTQSATSPTYEQVTRPIYTSSVEKWRHYENLLEPAMPLLEKAAKSLGFS